MTNMTTTTKHPQWEVLDWWRAFNMRGEGKESGKLAEYSYHKEVIFFNSNPWRRIIREPRQASGWIELVQSPDSVECGRLKDSKTIYISVPSIGVLSRWPDDMFEIEDLHKRMKYLLLMELKDHCENVLVGVSGRTLSDPSNYKNPREKVIQRANKMYGRWETYRNHFHLDWPVLPDRYVDGLRDEIKRKIDAYMDPKSVEKRERQRARKNAVKALLG
jgi:hypothetical protein